jgi:hypothetical protein
MRTKQFIHLTLLSLASVIGCTHHSRKITEEKYCALIEWGESNTKDTFEYYGQVMLLRQQLNSIILENKTLTLDSLLGVKNLESGEIIAFDNKHCYYYIKPLLEGDCKSDKVMDKIRDGDDHDPPEDPRY